MGRPRTGSVWWHEDHWDIRITFGEGARSKPSCQPPDMSYEDARNKAQKATEDAKRTGAEKDKQLQQEPDESFPDYSNRWCDDRERRGLTSANDDRGRLSKWVFPIFSPNGTTPITSISKRDVETLVESLDNHVLEDEMGWKTARNTWVAVRKLLDDATNGKVRSMRVLSTNPALGVRGPDKGTNKAKVYLYPSEFLRLVSCAEIPVRWRRMYTLAIYFYVRAAELRGLEWTDVDLEHGVVFVHRALDDDGQHDTTKGEVPRRFKIEDELMPLLRAMHKESGGVGRVFDPMPSEKHMAPMLRRDLHRAGVTRAELFINDKTRKQMTFHDLRSTGITWMAVRGDDPLKIQHRAGHKDFKTTQGYIREVEHLREGFGTPFPPLPADLVSSGISSERVGRNGHAYRIKRKFSVGEAGFEPSKAGPP